MMRKFGPPSVLLVLLFSACSSVPRLPLAAGTTPAPITPKESCPSGKEFITAHEFLRAESAFAVPEKEARNVAFEVAKGCKGAAGRFIKTSRLLTKVGLATNDALSTAIKLAHKTDEEAETFAEVFRGCFLPEYLDLDVETSYNLATSLSLDRVNDRDSIRSDFKRFVNFCVSADSLDLPRPKCAGLAATLARKGENQTKSVYQPFVEAFTFLRSATGPQLNVPDALATSEELVGYSPDSVESFIQVYKYANSKAGLGLDARESVGFALKIAKTSAPIMLQQAPPPTPHQPVLQPPKKS